MKYGDVEIDQKDVLGVGSYGKVCRARCGQLPCAAKLLHDTMFHHGDPGVSVYVEKFEQECRFLCSFKHPNIIQYLATTRLPQSNLPAILMELMDESLTRFLERSPGPLPYCTQLNICHDIALALAYLHCNNVIHRDLSSNNVLLIGAGARVKVTDFGMSKLVDANPRMTPLTQCPGASVYMPPEALAMPPQYSSKLDCFSHGVLSIQIITRNFPSPGNAQRPIEDPNYPNQQLFCQVPEVDRRREDINLVEADHTLLPVALDCLKNKNAERPSAEELCGRLSTLKGEQRYASSMEQVRNRPAEILRLQRELEGKDRTIRELQQELQGKDELLEDSHDIIRELQQKLEGEQEVIHILKQEKKSDALKLDASRADVQQLLEVRKNMFEEYFSEVSQMHNKQLAEAQQRRSAETAELDAEMAKLASLVESSNCKLKKNCEDRLKILQQTEADYQMTLEKKKQDLLLRCDYVSIGEVLQELHDVHFLWHEIGLEAELTSEELRIVEVDGKSDPETCLLEVLKLWQVRKPLTWDRVVAVLMARWENKLAKELAESKGVIWTQPEEPPYPTQKTEIARVLQQRLKKGETWYLVDVRWIKQWKKYVGYDQWDQSLAGQESANPGPVDNSSLFKDGGGGKLKEHLMEELDYYLLPESAWNRLSSWYTISQGSHPIPRKVVEHGLYMKHCKLEVYLLEFKLATYANQNQVVSRQFSRGSSVAELEAELKVVLSVSKDAECRVWHRYMTNTYELLSNASQTLQDAGLYTGQTIVLEEKKEDGTWPRNIQVSPSSQHSTRHAAPLHKTASRRKK